MTTDRPTTEPRTDIHDLHDVIDGPDYTIIEDEAERLLERVRAEGRAEAAQGAAPDDKTPFQRVVDDLTEGDGCACHTGTGYNSACRHCQPQMYSEGAAPRAEGLDVERLRKALKALPVADMVVQFPTNDPSVWRHVPLADAIASEFARLSRPSDGGSDV